MNDSIFLDTNVLVYAHTDLDTIKQATAQKLMEKGPSFVSTQVLQELANTLNRKFKHSWNDIGKVLSDVAANNNLYVPDECYPLVPEQPFPPVPDHAFPLVIGQ